MELLSKQTYNKDTCTDMSTSSEEVQERPGRIKPQGKVLQKLTLFCISNFILHYFMIFFFYRLLLLPCEEQGSSGHHLPCYFPDSKIGRRLAGASEDTRCTKERMHDTGSKINSSFDLRETSPCLQARKNFASSISALTSVMRCSVSSNKAFLLLLL